MKNSVIPKTIQTWIDKNPGLVDEYHMEDDAFDGRSFNNWSIWLYLKPGFINQGVECHFIHECTVKDFFDHVAEIKPCDCDDCKYELNKIEALKYESISSLDMA